MSVEWMVSSSAMIFLVVLIRFAFRKKMQPGVRYALWFAVVLRLLIPGSFSETSVSVLNFVPEKVPEETGQEKEQGKGEKAEGFEEFLPEREQPDKELPDKGREEKEGAEKEEAVKKIPDGELSEKEPEGRKMPEEAERLNAGKPDMGRLAGYIWLTGAVLCGIVLAAVNLDYARRLAKSRKRVREEDLPAGSKIPVYIAEIIQTPCLFGFLHPAVYVTEAVAGEERTFAYVLCHENIHYKHRDNWWVFVRNLCLCLHWFNLFVWLAAYLSRQDGELACDERVLEELGRENRVDYGRILLELSTAEGSGISGWRISTTMGGNKKQMKERLQMLMDAPGKAVGVRACLLFLMVFVFVLTFTGRSGQSFAAPDRGYGSCPGWE